MHWYNNANCAGTRFCRYAWKVFSIQIFQYFPKIPPRVCTLVLFIIQAFHSVFVNVFFGCNFLFLFVWVLICLRSYQVAACFAMLQWFRKKTREFRHIILRYSCREVSERGVCLNCPEHETTRIFATFLHHCNNKSKNSSARSGAIHSHDDT